MEISPDEARQALADIERISEKTRRSIADSGTHIYLLLTGFVWMAGYLGNQFLPVTVIPYVWAGAAVIASVAGVILGIQAGRRVRRPSAGPLTRRAFIFWVILAGFCVATLSVAQPLDGMQITMIIILFIMLGQLSMGMITSYSTVWWAIPIAILALIGYFLLPGIFYLGMGLLVGGGMIALGLIIRFRW